MNFSKIHIVPSQSPLWEPLTYCPQAIYDSHESTPHHQNARTWQNKRYDWTFWVQASIWQFLPPRHILGTLHSTSFPLRLFVCVEHQILRKNLKNVLLNFQTVDGEKPLPKFSLQFSHSPWFEDDIINSEIWSLYLPLFLAFTTDQGRTKVGIYFEIKEAFEVLYKSNQDL